jgi:hypothetical protein
MGAVLPRRTAMVETKTPWVTAMVEAQTTINNQLKAAAATAMETATRMTIKMQAAEAAALQQLSVCGGGSAALAAAGLAAGGRALQGPLHC